MDPRRLDIVAQATSQIGPGTIPVYWAECGIPWTADLAKRAWCGLFALAMLHRARVGVGVDWQVGLGFCFHLTLTKSPQPGDIAYLDAPYEHHAIVESLVNGILTTIDGNQPDVRRRVRPVPAGMVFYSIDRFLGASPVPAPSPPAPTPSPPAPDSLVRGIDVSHHQLPSAVNYAELAKSRRFVIARACYGARPDETFAEHVHRAEDAGLIVGAYAFFRPGDAVTDQLDAFGAAVEAAGMGPGWLAPALDVEQNPTYDGPVTTDRYAPAAELCAAWRDRWGASMLYTNPSMWAAIGSPDWLRQCELWISHYGVQHPTTPLGLPWALWQHQVGVLPGICPAPLDQNIANALPLLRELGAPELLPLEVDWDSLRQERDAWIRDGQA